MLIVLFTLFLLNGGPADVMPALMLYLEENREAVETVITDEARQQDALAILEAMKERSVLYSDQRTEAGEKLGALVQGRESHSAEIADILAAHRKDTKAYSKDILDLRFELKDHIPREEWDQIFSE